MLQLKRYTRLRKKEEYVYILVNNLSMCDNVTELHEIRVLGNFKLIKILK